MEHTFVICAYKESEFLEECIRSLLAQTEKSKIIMVTSTPGAFLEEMAQKYNLELIVNPGEGGITQDWNFGLSQVQTPFATIAHQDDVYEPEYAAQVLKGIKAANHPLIAFTDYFEVRNGKKTYNTSMLRIKQKMLAPLKSKRMQNSRFIRRRILSLGDPICCPAVTYCMQNLTLPIFRNHYRSVEDWEAWEKISAMEGAFVYVPQPLMGHRIHEESETSKIIGDGKRGNENYEMYRKFWPAPIAKLINRFYARSERSNEL